MPTWPELFTKEELILGSLNHERLQEIDSLFKTLEGDATALMYLGYQVINNSKEYLWLILSEEIKYDSSAIESELLQEITPNTSALRSLTRTTQPGPMTYAFLEYAVTSYGEVWVHTENKKTLESIFLDASQAEASEEFEFTPNTESRRLFLGLSLALEMASSLPGKEIININLVSLGDDLPELPSPSNQSVTTKEHTVIPNNDLHRLLQKALTGTQPLKPGSQWPTTEIQTNSVTGQFVMKPKTDPNLSSSEEAQLVKKIWDAHRELSDLDVDVLDILLAAWAYSVQSRKELHSIRIDDIIDLRGLKKKKGGSGRRGGYYNQARIDVLRAVGRIQSFLLKVEVMEFDPKNKRKAIRKWYESQALTVTDAWGQEAFYLNADGSTMQVTEAASFNYIPGDALTRFLFGDDGSRQTALLPLQALRYNPSTQRWEKRLTRYFTWIWRIRATQQRFVSDHSIESLLLEVLGSKEEYLTKRLDRIRDRFEKAMDRLKDDEILTWEYINYDSFGEDNQKWLKASIKVAAPDLIKTQYSEIKRFESPKAIQQLKSGDIIDRVITKLSTNKNITQGRLAEHFGISSSQLNRVLSRQRTLTNSLREKFETWLAENN